MTRQQWLIGISCLVALVVVVGAAFFGVPALSDAIYNAGYSTGRKEALAETPSLSTTTVSVTEVIPDGGPVPSAGQSGVTSTPALPSSSPVSSSSLVSASTTVVTPEGPQTASVLEHGLLLPDDVFPLDVFQGPTYTSSFGKSGDNSKILAYGLTGSLYLCNGNYVPKSTGIADSINATWSASGQGWGTELTSYQPGQAKAIFDTVWAKANDCGNTLPNKIAALGDDAFRLSTQDGSGSSISYSEEVFILVKDVVIQVGLTTQAGDHGSSAEALARLALRKYLNLNPWTS